MRIRKAKTLLSVLLCVCLIAALAFPAFAARDCGCGEVVHVWLGGFGQALYYDEGGPQEQKAKKSDTSGVVQALPALLPAAVRSAGEGSWSPFVKALSGILADVMVYYRLDENGKSIAPISSSWVLDETQDHSAEPKYLFRYDFRLDPFDLAAQLNDFIETLCAHTGHGKIALSGCSEGSVVAMTYLKEYGAARLDSLLIVNGSWQGLTLVGELFTKRVEISGAGLANYLSNEADALMTAAMDVLRTSKVLDFLPGLSKRAMDALGDTLYTEALLPIFGHMPALWAFVPDEYYEEAVQTMLGSDPKYDGLKARIDRYHYEVMLQAPALLADAMNSGAKVSVIASYGLAPMPFTRDALYQSDGFVDSAREAGGATYAPLYGTLPPSESPYRSPDGVFDAASCILPEQTWFIQGNAHEEDCMQELIDWLIHSEQQPTIRQNSAYPQYLRRTADEKVIPLEAGAAPGQVQSLWAALQVLLKLVLGMLKG